MAREAPKGSIVYGVCINCGALRVVQPKHDRFFTIVHSTEFAVTCEPGDHDFVSREAAPPMVRNGKNTPKAGVIPNARYWKDLTPRKRSGPFLRLRDKNGDWLR